MFKVNDKVIFHDAVYLVVGLHDHANPSVNKHFCELIILWRLKERNEVNIRHLLKLNRNILPDTNCQTQIPDSYIEHCNLNPLADCIKKVIINIIISSCIDYVGCLRFCVANKRSEPQKYSVGNLRTLLKIASLIAE